MTRPSACFVKTLRLSQARPILPKQALLFPHQDLRSNIRACPCTARGPIPYLRFFNSAAENSRINPRSHTKKPALSDRKSGPFKVQKRQGRFWTLSLKSTAEGTIPWTSRLIRVRTRLDDSYRITFNPYQHPQTAESKKLPFLFRLVRNSKLRSNPACAVGLTL